MEEFDVSSVLSIYDDEIYKIDINSVPDSALNYLYNIFIKLDEQKTRLFIDSNYRNCSNNIKIYINKFPLSSGGYGEPLKDINDITITFENNLISTEQSLIFRDKDDFQKYLEVFFSKVKIGDLCNVERKIVYKIINANQDFSSSLFSKKMNEDLELYSIFKNEKLYKDQKVVGIIESVPKALRVKQGYQMIEGFLSILSDRTIDKGKATEFVISLGNRSYITVNDIENTEETVGILGEIQKFIFVSSEKYYDRLNIFRNIFSDKIENKVDINAEVLKQILDESKLHYNLFIGDKIKQFVLEKQKVTEDYLKLSGEIVKRINVVTDEIPKQLLTIIGVIITTFFLKGIDQTIRIWIVPLLALIYLLVLIIFRWKRGWYFESENLEMQKKLMDESYEELYTLNDEFIQKLDNEYFKPKLKELKQMENLSLGVTVFIAIVIGAWFLWA
ncbi:hypothetical protein ACTCUF_04220 [Lactococcus lactis]|uniref:hypothetical protein n=1 Tax=Lactococcus lactis TaxID=1358 RepID=UPI003F82AC4D